jgi:hypothetical protein
MVESTDSADCTALDLIISVVVCHWDRPLNDFVEPAAEYCSKCDHLISNPCVVGTNLFYYVLKSTIWVVFWRCHVNRHHSSYFDHYICNLLARI